MAKALLKGPMGTHTPIQPPTTDSAKPSAGELLADITKDLKTIAEAELELTRRKLIDYMENLVRRASIALLGMVIAVIGLGMVCVVGVVALEPLIEPLWLRLLMMSIVYMGLGAAVAFLYAKRMTNGPHLRKQFSEVGETIDAVQRGLDS